MTVAPASRFTLWVALAVSAVALLPVDLGWGLVHVGALAGCAAAVWAWWRWAPERAVALGESLHLRTRAVLDQLGRLPQAPFLAGLFSVNLGVSAALAWVTFERVPHVADSAAQFFHARMWADHGVVAAPPPPLALEFFETSMILHDPMWFSQYPVGHVAALALGHLVGLVWLVGPVLGAATAVVTVLAGEEIFGRSVGRMAGLLMTLAPTLQIMSASLMNHTTAHFGAALFLLGYVRLLRAEVRVPGLLAWGGVSGLGIAVVFATRPLTALGIAFPFIVHAVATLVRLPERRWGLYVTAATGCLGPLAIVFWNLRTTGSALTMGYVAAHGSRQELGFGLRLEGLYTPGVGLLQMVTTLQQVSYGVLYWLVPVVPIAALSSCIGVPSARRTASRLSHSAWARLLGASFLSLLLIHLLYFSNLWIYGPRNQFESFGMLLLLVALGLDRTVAWSRGQKLRLRSAVTVTLIGALAASALASAAYLVRQAGALQGYRGVTSDVVRTVDDADLEDALLFVPEERWTSAHFLNDALLAGDVVFAKDRGARNWALVDELAGRAPYLLCGDVIEPLLEDRTRMSPPCRALDPKPLSFRRAPRKTQQPWWSELLSKR